MKNSYTGSLVAVTSAITEACLLYATKGSSGALLNTNNYQKKKGVGIKFDNISAGKYFVLIHTLHRHPMVNKTREKSDDAVLSCNKEAKQGRQIAGLHEDGSGQYQSA